MFGGGCLPYRFTLMVFIGDLDFCWFVCFAVGNCRGGSTGFKLGV